MMMLEAIRKIIIRDMLERIKKRWVSSGNRLQGLCPYRNHELHADLGNLHKIDLLGAMDHGGATKPIQPLR